MDVPNRMQNNRIDSIKISSNISLFRILTTFLNHWPCYQNQIAIQKIARRHIFRAKPVGDERDERKKNWSNHHKYIYIYI